jgi:hypothetical protein
MALVKLKIPDQTNLSEEDKAFWADALKKHGEHKDSGFFDEREKPDPRLWYLPDVDDDIQNVEEPSLKEKVTSAAYGFNKGLGKTVDSVAAAGNAIYGGISGGMANLTENLGMEETSKDFRYQANQAYDDANKLWNGKVAEQYVEDNYKPDAIEKYKGTDQQYVIDNYVSAGHTVESLVEMSAGGGVLKLGGKGVAALVSNPSAKNFLVNNKVTNFLNTLVSVEVNPVNTTAAAVGGYLANNFREEDEIAREQAPIEDTARTLGGYIAGDVATRGVYAGGISGTAKFILQKALPKTTYNGLMKNVAELKEPFVEGLYKGLDTVQETAGNWINGLVFKSNTDVGKLTMRRLRDIEQASKEAIEYVSTDTGIMHKGNTSFAAWLLHKKDNPIDMEFLESVAPELANMLNSGADKKTIIRELTKNKDLVNAYTLQKHNAKAIELGLYLPDYTLKEKLLKDTQQGLIDFVKRNLGDFSKNAGELTYTNKIEDFKTLLPQFNSVLTKERNLNHDRYRQILSSNENSIISLEEFIPELKQLSDDFKIFSPTSRNDTAEISAIEQVSDTFNRLFSSASSAESRNVNGRIVKNAINPIELVNKRQSLNDISYRGNSNVEELQRKAVSLIDRIIEKNTDLGNLPEEFITSYRKALDFDSKVYFSFTQDEIIKTLLQGEPTGYISNIMNTSRGVEQVRKALSNTTEQYKNFHTKEDILKQNKQLADDYYNRILFAYRKGLNNKRPLTGERTIVDKDGYEINKLYTSTSTSTSTSNVIKFPNKKDLEKAREFKNTGNDQGLTNLAHKYNLDINENRELISKMDGKSRELFDALRQIKLKKLIFDDFINYEKTNNRFDFNTFKIQSTILDNENLIRSLVRDEKQAEFIIKKLPVVLNKVGEISNKIKINSDSSKDITQAITRFATKTGIGATIGNAAFGPVGGFAGAVVSNQLVKLYYRGLANSFDKPETTAKLIGLIEKGNDTNILKFLLKQANVYSYDAIKKDVGGSKTILKEKAIDSKDWLLEPQTIPWNER